MGYKGKLGHRKDFLTASLGRVQTGRLGQGEGQPSEVRCGGQGPGCQHSFCRPRDYSLPSSWSQGDPLPSAPTPFTSQQLIPS